MTGTAPPIGVQLRQWRELRRRSQLVLASEVDVSTRHLSFIETGRSRPSRAMVLRLAEHLDVPLRERNRLLLAAGYAPVYQQTPLGSLDAVAAAVRQVLDGHDPYPAVVVDAHSHLLDANDSATLFLHAVAAHLLVPPANTLRIALHPDGMAPHIQNLPQWRTHLLDRLRRQVAHHPDPGLVDLLDELRGYPGGEAADGDLGNLFALPLRYRHDGHDLAFISTVATFGAPLDVTVAELAIESFFPADAATAAFLHQRSGT